MKLPEISTKVCDKHSNKVRRAEAQNGIEAPSDNERSRRRESQEKMLTCDSVHRKCSGEQNQRLKSLMLFFFFCTAFDPALKNPADTRNAKTSALQSQSRMRKKTAREYLDKLDALRFLLSLLQPLRKFLSPGSG